MKKLLIVLLAISLFSCETEEKVKSDIDKLRDKRTVLQNEVADYNRMIDDKQAKLSRVDDDLKAAKIYLSGKTPKYILKLKLKQSHMSLDIGKHIKDGMNAIEFEMPVDKDLYNTVSVGTQIIDEFRSGSLIINGDFGNWKMTVVSKRIE